MPHNTPGVLDRIITALFSIKELSQERRTQDLEEILIPKIYFATFTASSNLIDRSFEPPSEPSVTPKSTPARDIVSRL